MSQGGLQGQCPRPTASMEPGTRSLGCRDVNFSHHLRSRGRGSPLAQQPDGARPSLTGLSLTGTHGAPDTQEPRGGGPSAGQPAGAGAGASRCWCSRTSVPAGSAADLCKMAMIHIFAAVAASPTLTARSVSERRPPHPASACPCSAQGGGGGTALRLAGKCTTSSHPPLHLSHPPSQGPPSSLLSAPLGGPFPHTWAGPRTPGPVTAAGDHRPFTVGPRGS